MGLIYNDKRFYSWSLILYEPSDIILFCVMSYKNIVHWALSPRHDKDTKDDGSFKEPHYHLLIVCKDRVSLNVLKEKCFNTFSSNIFGEKLIDKYQAYKYLSHDGFNDDSKALYSELDITSDNADFWIQSNNVDDSIQILNDLRNGVPIDSLVSIYGRKIIYHLKDYIYFLKAVDFQERNQSRSNCLKDFDERF